MGLLDGDLAKAIHTAFKGKLLPALLRQVVTADSGGLDDWGDAQDHEPVDTPCEGFVDAYSAAYRARAGIPDTDLKVCLIAGSLGDVVPTKDDRARINRAGVLTWYQIRAVATDPAHALWECQSFEIADPDA